MMTTGAMGGHMHRQMHPQGHGPQTAANARQQELNCSKLEDR